MYHVRLRQLTFAPHMFTPNVRWKPAHLRPICMRISVELLDIHYMLIPNNSIFLNNVKGANGLWVRTTRVRK